MYSFQIKYLEDEKLVGYMEKTCWQNCTQRILDDIIGSHANTVSCNNFENNLKKVFWNLNI